MDPHPKQKVNTIVQQDNKPIRQSNIELLRILAMLGVVILHYNKTTIGKAFAYVAQESVNHRLLQGTESLLICAVNVFVLITGYFSCTSCRADPLKAVMLLLQVILYRAILYGWDVWHGVSFSAQGLFIALMPANWFVVLYASMYLLSPFINRLLRELSQDALHALVVLCGILFSVWPTLADAAQMKLGVTLTGVTTISMDGSGNGYTLVHFLLMYLIGAYLRLSGKAPKKRYCGIMLFVCAALLTVLSTVDTSVTWSYSNPLVIMEAVAVFLLFRQLRLQSRLINCLASGAFMCYIVHSRFLLLFDISGAVRSTPLYLLGHMLLTAVTIYLYCFGIHLIYSLISSPLTKVIGWCLKKLRLSDIVVMAQQDNCKDLTNKENM